MIVGAAAIAAAGRRNFFHLTSVLVLVQSYTFFVLVLASPL